jgi:hypothetical protein
MNNYKKFNECKYLRNLDQLDMLDIFLTWDKYKKYHKQEFKEYLKNCCDVLNEIEEQVKNECIF